MGEIAEDLVAVPADPCPDFRGQGGRHDLCGIQRQPVAPVAGQTCGEAFCRAQDDGGRDRAPVGLDPAFRDPQNGGALGNPHAPPLHGLCQTAHQPCRLDPGDVRDHHAAQRAGHVHPRHGRGCVDHPDAGLAPVVAMRGIGGQARQLGGVAGDHQFLGPPDMGVDALGLGHRDHRIDGALHRADQRAHGLGAAVRQVSRVVPGETAGQPAAVAARGAKAREFPLDDQDVEVGVAFLEIPGGPQAGVPGADDADIGPRVAGQGGAARRRAAEGGVPVRDFADASGGHAGQSGGAAAAWQDLPPRGRRCRSCRTAAAEVLGMRDFGLRGRARGLPGQDRGPAPGPPEYLGKVKREAGGLWCGPGVTALAFAGREKGLTSRV